MGSDWKCEGKKPSVSEKFIIDVLGVVEMSIQPFTKLVGIGLSPMTCMKPTIQYGARHRQGHKLGFSKNFLVLGGINTRECESEGKERRLYVVSKLSAKICN